MKTYSFAYGSGTVELPLDEKNVIGELHGNAVAPLADIRAALWASLDAPIDSAPLCERARAGDTVALVVSRHDALLDAAGPRGPASGGLPHGALRRA